MYFVGLAGGQLIWGPLSDRYGRKPVLAADFRPHRFLAGRRAASSVGAIAAARVAQGFAPRAARSSAAPSCAISTPTKQAARLLARMTVVFSIVPIAAPLAGALILEAAGWPSVFW